ncbi:pirin family protein [Allomesorhizobium camelthorni]|uniref:pirin family protein n=1 Tax=Allomesorhizobium camelthorni TaxID=475069 RepID=UPI003CCDDB6D
MSRNPGLEPHYPQAAELGAIETQIIPRARDSAASRFAEPFRRRPADGWPFHLLRPNGPAEFLTGNGIDVRPNPHIGLATVTYLFDGEFQHRDEPDDLSQVR